MKDPGKVKANFTLAGPTVQSSGAQATHTTELSPPHPREAMGSSVYPSISQPLATGHDGVKVTKVAPFS